MEKLPVILVIDDEKKNQVLIQAILRNKNYKIVTASDGEEGLKAVAEYNPDLILMDAMMPKLDGFEATKRIKSNDKTKIIPIIMVTALTNVEARIKALKAGADDFLNKPLDRLELIARVASSLKIKAYYDNLLNYQNNLEKEVEKRTKILNDTLRELQEASLETIQRLSIAAEYKDEDTAEHIQRISFYSATIAKELGLDKDFCDDILYSAPLHDIGKIGIPDKILLKPGKLTAEEWDVMKKHTTIGAQILSGSNKKLLNLGETIALFHHEKWNGTGYPQGLKGDKIPISGRIVAITDVFDALLSKRPYKDPFPLEKSLDIIKEGKGQHFDPDVVDAFFSKLNKILKIKEEMSNQGVSKFIEISENFI